MVISHLQWVCNLSVAVSIWVGRVNSFKNTGGISGRWLGTGNWELEVIDDFREMEIEIRNCCLLGRRAVNGKKRSWIGSLSGGLYYAIHLDFSGCFRHVSQ